jgi:exonuclease VII small subunit
VYVVRCGLATYRAFRDSLGAMIAALEEALGRLDEAPRHLDDAAASAEHLDAAFARLQRSRKRLALLLGAFAEVRAGVGGALAFLK